MSVFILSIYRYFPYLIRKHWLERLADIYLLSTSRRKIQLTSVNVKNRMPESGRQSVMHWVEMRRIEV